MSASSPGKSQNARLTTRKPRSSGLTRFVGIEEFSINLPKQESAAGTPRKSRHMAAVFQDDDGTYAVDRPTDSGAAATQPLLLLLLLTSGFLRLAGNGPTAGCSPPAQGRHDWMPSSVDFDSGALGGGCIDQGGRRCH